MATRPKDGWPILTKAQKALMLKLDAAPDGTLRYPINRTYFRLNHEGMLRGETIMSNFCTITQRGRDYVRFHLKVRP